MFAKEQMMNISAFIEKHGIRGSAEKVDKNPFLTDDIPWNATHWLVTLCHKDATLETFFSSGGEFKSKPPKIIDVILRLMDMSLTAGLAKTFEAWAQALGYDETSVISEKRYKQYCLQVDGFKEFLGEDLYLELIHKVEIAA
jgi:hypothetical protein